MDGQDGNGRHSLQSANTTFTTALAIPSGTLTNAGIIESNTGSGGARSISGTVVNPGTLTVNETLAYAGTLTNTGTVRVAAGERLTLSGATQVLNQNAGSLTGGGTVELSGGATLNHNGGTATGMPPLLISSRLNLGSSADPASFILTGLSQWSDNLQAGQTVWISGRGVGGHTTVTAAGDFSNAGTILIQSGDTTFTSGLTISGNGTLTNTGLIDVQPGSGGARSISGNITNEGAFNVDTPVTVTGGSFVNGTGGVVRGHSTLTLSTATLANGGSIAPGTSPGILTLGGAMAQGAAGSLDIEIGGATAGTQFDQFRVTGSATLDGTLNLSLTGGFDPSIGSTFDVLTYGSRTGTFATVNGLSIGNGKKFAITYAATKATLSVVPE